MDIFKCIGQPETPAKIEQGEFINGLKEILWVERYRDAGEFKLVSHESYGILDKLPPGSIISHVDTSELMMVENHEYSKNQDASKNDVITTGRSLEAVILENRIIGSNRVWSSGSAPASQGQYTLRYYSWQKVAALIEEHIDPFTVIYTTDGITGIDTSWYISRPVFSYTDEDQPIPFGQIYPVVLRVLEEDDLGLKIIRPRGPGNTFPAEQFMTRFIIHDGIDRKTQISFDQFNNTIESADYLQSIKSLKNVCVITGKWVAVIVDQSTPGLNKRYIHVDGAFIDNSFAAMPVGVDYTNVVTMMTAYGQAVLNTQKRVSIVNTAFNERDSLYLYRRDYNIGDLVTLKAHNGTTSTMRVTEYVEVEDENGYSSYPTLSAV